jgi:hypothetical protein
LLLYNGKIAPVINKFSILWITLVGTPFDVSRPGPLPTTLPWQVIFSNEERVKYGAPKALGFAGCAGAQQNREPPESVVDFFDSLVHNRVVLDIVKIPSRKKVSRQNKEKLASTQRVKQVINYKIPTKLQALWET